MISQVIIAEDQTELRQSVCWFLEQRFNVDIHEAEDGEQALKPLRSNPDIYLLIADLNTPGLDGIELTWPVRSIAAFQSLPIVMFTAEGDDCRVLALDAGINEFYDKPMQPDTRLPAVTQYLSS